jgi:hypothetical protein
MNTRLGSFAPHRRANIHTIASANTTGVSPLESLKNGSRHSIPSRPTKAGSRTSGRYSTLEAGSAFRRDLGRQRCPAPSFGHWPRMDTEKQSAPADPKSRRGTRTAKRMNTPGKIYFADAFAASMASCQRPPHRLSFVWPDRRRPDRPERSKARATRASIHWITQIPENHHREALRTEN